MTDNFLTIALIVIIPIIFLVALRIYNKRNHSDSHKVAVILKPYSKEEVKDFIIPDGIGGILEIEHLILLNQGFLLVKTYPMSGNLFGADEIDQWSQIVAGKSFKFDNPLRQIQISRQALKALAPNIPIFCRIIFTSNSIFPKGKPQEVSTLDTLTEDLQAINSTIPMDVKVQRSWDRVMRIARKNGKSVKE